jgi:hypothetical protein
MISMIWSGEGYGPILVDQRARPVGSFSAGLIPFMDRSSSVEETGKSEMMNSFHLRFAYDPIKDIHRGSIIRNASNSVLCRWSRDQVGERYAGVMDSVTIYDTNAAGYVVDWLVEHFARPSYYVEYSCLSVAWLLFRLGDTLLFSDSEFSWSSERAVVERMEYQRGRVTVGLRVWPSFLNRAVGAMISYTS